MKEMRVLVIICFLLGTKSVFSQVYIGESKIQKTIQTKAASCAPASKTTFIDYNNVRAMVHTAGNLWQVPGQNFSQYEIPKNSKIMCFFTSALWLGGTDVNGQLKLAALRYRTGQDYWTGPLANGTAEIDADECLKYDNHFTSSKDVVKQFDAWYNAGVLDQQNGTNLQTTNFPNYQVPDFIKNWPAHGDVSKGQDYNLAPFFDRDNDGEYEWQEGDYPWYDINGTKNCKTDRRVSLYGDFNMWWVMNDKGNIHTESQGEPIGMEIRAQAFAFATNDDVNNMTFYNYELINRGTQTLFETYFGVFVDGALGDPFDDYVGCDVSRGLGYFYNGDSYDGENQGFYGYGANPPAAGVDFFEGPYQDNDSIDNSYGIGAGEALNGIGYGDGIVDNERFGMRRFLYYINAGAGTSPNQTDPTSAFHYYCFLRGRWKDNTPFYYGGNGHISDPTVNPSVTCDFMFPDDTDPLGWGTGGIPQPDWTEETANNLPYDRRFLQSAGPFILKPGAVNNITVGMVWARSLGGGPFESVNTLRVADDKAQALFENCFRVLEGPHAPDMSGQELKNELILYLSNNSASNNEREDYMEFDPLIVATDSTADKNYRFQGYLIYQLYKSNVSVSDLEDQTKARLVAQVDIKDGVKRLINFEFDENLLATFPVEKVVGADLGIRHSFRVTEDLFASGDRRLINFKRYYYMAISYAHNNYKSYDPTDPNALDGQKKPFLGSRKAAIGEVKVLELIPHDPSPESMGTMHLASYGITPRITRLDGTGNGSRSLELTTASEDAIVANGFKDKLEYDYNGGPINVKVVDPLNVVGGYFECKFRNYVGVSGNGITEIKGIDTSSWVINRYDTEGGNLLDSVTSDVTIKQGNEQVVPKWGVSIEIFQDKYYYPVAPNSAFYLYTDPLSSSISYSDSTKRWLDFVEDDASLTPRNWLRTGTYAPVQATDCDTWGGASYLNPCCFSDEIGLDPKEKYNKLLGGGVGPHKLTGYQCDFMPLAYPTNYGGIPIARTNASIKSLPSVDIVMTPDKTKWTRCVVVELGRDANLNQGGGLPGRPRASASVDKNGNPDGTPTTGMGWFPGYAIDLETGARLHMAFGENSFLGGDNGADMVWNPSSRQTDGNGLYVNGGNQPIWVFGVNINNEGCPYYDGTNTWVYDQFQIATNTSYKKLYTSLMWIANTITAPGHSVLESTARLKLRVNKQYADFTATGLNGGKPMYSWSMNDLQTTTGSRDALASALDLINVVPNPYYAFSEYERSKVDNRIKIINLPKTCTVTIYTTSGKLVNQFKKDYDVTFIDWALTNNIGIPVASGVYLIHVDVPGVGERVLKSFIAMRKLDIEGF
ncbi:T9SS type A sorting domain-containing protein [Fluviicola taffensis]|uniref:T9SS C-terminal target domain-containing protein n=1 Tax=Fluviicola taffensis (strain DSM 16823 / NCIMB 13979 / RW262) TaxID=755732 RepID=F2IAK5_FLUTR|nr:T9SS type A sorting domain-containing protein [Fluviicola taffensis]AEA43141.1 hypothetical protein Fluta_1145 [Fluviicola taffensis DSM 16823]